jgi:hypothetical protein
MQIEVKKGAIIMNCTPTELFALQQMVARGDNGDCGKTDCKHCPTFRKMINVINEANDHSSNVVNDQEINDFTTQ